MASRSGGYVTTKLGRKREWESGGTGSFMEIGVVERARRRARNRMARRSRKRNRR